MKVETVAVRKKNFLDYLKQNNISEDIAEAFKQIDQAQFFDRMFADKLYSEEQIPTGYGEKGDSIHLMAKMINYLSPKKNMRILEIGTGSGFSTAILSVLCKEVYTIDMDEKLAAVAKSKLYNAGYENIRFFAGDGTDPEIDFGKVDAAIIWAGCYKRPLTVLQHVAPKGLLVYPMGPVHMQQIVILKNESDVEKGMSFKLSFKEQGYFCPIKGRYGYDQIVDLGSEIYADTVEVDHLPKSYEDEGDSLFKMGGTE